jgi:hypothetical protein
VLIIGSVLIIAVWRLYHIWPHKRLVPGLKRRRPRLYYVLSAIAVAALIFWIYLISQITREAP